MPNNKPPIVKPTNYIYSPIGYQLDTPTATLTTVNVHHAQQLKFHSSLGGGGGAGNNHFTKEKPPLSYLTNILLLVGLNFLSGAKLFSHIFR